MTVDVFLRSYSADLPWVPYALRSLHKFVSGIQDVVIVVPEKDLAVFKSLNFTREVIYPSKLQTFRDDYMGQQADKLMADYYTEADNILFWDSDCIAIRKFSPEDLMIDGKPRCLMTPYARLVNADGKPDTPWRPITEKAICCPVDYEFMRAHPFIVPWGVLPDFRKFMQTVHGCSIGEYIEKQPGRSFSEFNALHAWAYYYPVARDLFYWWNTETDGVPQPVIKQHWSYGGITPEIRAEIERILA